MMGAAESETAAADQLRTGLHGMWASVAPAWGEYAENVDDRSAGTTERLLELASLREGDRVLELACGPGGLGLAAATRLGASGEVVLSDVAAEMTAVAEKRAAARGLDNVSTRVLDLEQIDEPDHSYDVVLCREGLMFALDPARATQEIHRVLRPGGRLVIAVWGPREKNPWLGIVLDATSAQLGAPVPPPGIPGPFSLQDSGKLNALLADGGLEDVEIEELAVQMGAASFEEWWSRTCALAGPLTSILASLPEDAASALRDRAAETVGPYQTADGLDLPGLTLIATGRRPAK